MTIAPMVLQSAMCRPQCLEISHQHATSTTRIANHVGIFTDAKIACAIDRSRCQCAVP